MFHREYIFLAFSALACVVVVLSVDAPGPESAANVEGLEECDIPVKDPYITWDIAKKSKGKCGKGEEPICAKCDMHTYKHRKGRHQMCIDCDEGKGTVDVGSSKCRRYCTEGKYFHAEDASCTPCPTGTYMDFKCLKTACKVCPDNLTTLGEGAKSKDDCGFSCPAGMGPNKDFTDCEPCPEGTVKEKAGFGVCNACPGTQTTLEDGAKNKTTECVKTCPAGKEYNDGVCSPCKKDYFKATEGSRERCQPCGINKATAKIGSDSCFVDCGAGYQEDGSGGCTLCHWGTFKSKSGNLPCERCPDTATGIRKWTYHYGATGKAECARLPDCVNAALEHLTDYYDLIGRSNFTGADNIFTFWKATCFNENFLTISAIINDFRTCADVANIKFPSITIGSHTYTEEEQVRFFVAAAEHDASYCDYLKCTTAHLKEIEKCKKDLEVDSEDPWQFCSKEWCAGSNCIMLNVKNCPPLQFHPAVTQDINLGGLTGTDLLHMRSLKDACFT